MNEDQDTWSNPVKDLPVVVVDTNILVYKSFLLRSALGSALVHALSRLPGKLGLPEVVEMEVRKHVHKQGKEFIDKIHVNYKGLKSLMGRRDDYRVPSDDDIGRMVDDRIDELSPWIQRMPFTFQHARAALCRVVEDKPPNSPKRQQFKDSAIWEAVLDMSKQGPVHFLTEDTGFFESGNPGKGLEASLQAEVDATAHPVMIHDGIGPFLSSIREDIPELDDRLLISVLGDSIKSSLSQYQENRGIELADVISSDVQRFVTEVPTRIALDFSIDFAARLLSDNQDLVVRILGDCIFEHTAKSIEDFKLNRIEVFDAAATPIPSLGVVMLHGETVVLGRKVVPHRVKTALDF